MTVTYDPILGALRTSDTSNINSFSTTIIGGDGAITSGQNTLTSSTGGFTTDLVGKTICIRGAKSGNLDLVTTISAVNSTTLLTLAASATATVSGACYLVGSTKYTPMTVFNVLAGGAMNDGKSFADGAITTGTKNFSSASASFVSSDVGKLLAIQGAGPNNGVMYGHISTVTDGQHVVLDTNATNTVSGASYLYGTNNTTLINNFINNVVVPAGGGILYFPQGKYLIGSGIAAKNHVSIIGDGQYGYHSATTGAYIGGSCIAGVGYSVAGHITSPGTYANVLTDCTFKKFEIDGSYTMNGSNGATYSVSSKAFYTPYTKDVHISDLYIHDTFATGIGFDFTVNGSIIHNRIYNCGRGNNGSLPGGAGIGNGTGAFQIENLLVAFNDIDMNNNGTYGVFYEIQGDPTATVVPGTNNGYYSTGMRVIGNNIVNCRKGAIGFAGTRGAIAEGNNITNCTIGIADDSGTMSVFRSYDSLINGNNISNCTNYGIYADRSLRTNGMSGLTIENNVIKGCGSIGSYYAGIHIYTVNTENSDGISIKNNTIKNGNATGIYVYNSGTAPTLNALDISNNTITNNSQGSSGTYDAITLTPNTNSSKISNNILSDYQVVPTQAYGLRFSSSTSHNGLLVASNNILGNVTGSIYAPSLTGTLVFRGNRGYIPNNPNPSTQTTSPYTYTAGAMDEYVNLSATTITAITSNGQTVFSGSVTLIPIYVNARQSIVITYTGTLGIRPDYKQGG